MCIIAQISRMKFREVVLLVVTATLPNIHEFIIYYDFPTLFVLTNISFRHNVYIYFLSFITIIIIAML